MKCLKADVWIQSNLSDEALALETSAFKLLTVANLRYKLCW